MGNVDSLVGGFRSSLKKQRPQKNPIQDHPLANADDEVRKMYIDTLCVVARYENENAEKELAFVERIHSGAGLTNNFSEHIDGVDDISSEQLHAFIDVCKKNKLENIFVLDCMLTAQADGTRNEEQYGFASDLAEALGLKEDRVSLLSELADVISEKDGDKYHELYEKLSPADAAEVIGGAIGYIKEFVSGVLIDTPELLWICSQKRNEYVIEANETLEDDELRFRMVNVVEKIGEMKSPDIKYAGYRRIFIENSTIRSILGIIDCKSIVIKNCTIGVPLFFNNLDNVTIESCTFDFERNKPIYPFCAMKVSCISICSSKFSNVIFDGLHGALIFLLSCGTLNLDSSSFFNLSNSNGNVIISSRPFGDISLSLTVRNCDFTNCSGKALFPSGIDMVSENNTYSNCCCEVSETY